MTQGLLAPDSQTVEWKETSISAAKGADWILRQKDRYA